MKRKGEIEGEEEEERSKAAEDLLEKLCRLRDLKADMAQKKHTAGCPLT